MRVTRALPVLAPNPDVAPVLPPPPPNRPPPVVPGVPKALVVLAPNPASRVVRDGRCESECAHPRRGRGKQKQARGRKGVLHTRCCVVCSVATETAETTRGGVIGIVAEAATTTKAAERHGDRSVRTFQVEGTIASSKDMVCCDQSQIEGDMDSVAERMARLGRLGLVARLSHNDYIENRSSAKVVDWRLSVNRVVAMIGVQGEDAQGCEPRGGAGSSDRR